MKLRQLTKLDQGNKATSKQLTKTSCPKIMTSLLFFQITANSEQFGGRIPDAQPLKLIFSLKVIFYLTKTEN